MYRKIFKMYYAIFSLLKSILVIQNENNVFKDMKKLNRLATYNLQLYNSSNIIILEKNTCMETQVKLLIYTH